MRRFWTLTGDVRHQKFHDWWHMYSWSLLDPPATEDDPDIEPEIDLPLMDPDDLDGPATGDDDDIDIDDVPPPPAVDESDMGFHFLSRHTCKTN